MSELMVRGADVQLGRILARSVADRGAPRPPEQAERARRRERCRASAELDRLLGVDQPGRVHHVGEYNPAAARIAAAATDAQAAFVTDARRYALRILLAIESGGDAADVWGVILDGGAALRRTASGGGA